MWFIWNYYRNFAVAKSFTTKDKRIRGNTIMAIAIKTIPVLTGEAAERFVMEVEENAKRPTPKLSPERKSRLEMVLNQMRDFQFQ